MEPIKTIKSKTFTIDIDNIDTDMIIPAQFLTSTSKTGYGENAFKRLKESDPSFPMNLDKNKGRRILISSENFGCGSSREHAVWALKGAGIDCIIAKSFADIFFSNSAKNGLLLISLDENIVDELMEISDQKDLELEVDLEHQTIKSSDYKDLSFEYDSFRRHCLLNGLEDVDYLLSHKDEIDTFKKERAKSLFYKTSTKNN